ncbi:NAD(P)-binding protein [Penicillium odoratum]|uniref:NAD(P)-binding protein n=1 Tax=Penicillium odoratum TaxID=1167516 RepID=UPI002549730C|nr:NAD(P)-binding protein [Penicillium odoratum]KAJ5769315.1 NAD(P)-binding protein [Penicillium odoratum]
MPPSDQEDFPIRPNLSKGLRLFFYSQFFITPERPTHSFPNQTVIVTGANSGLGLEAAGHFYRLHCGRLILAVRTIAKGQEAKEYILRNNPQRSDPNAIEIWPLDLSSTASTLAFSDRAKGLPRLDVLVNNAGINTPEWKLYEGYEQAVQINVLNTFLLALVLLPKLEESFALTEESPHLVIVSSEAHRLTKFPEINAPDLYAKLNDQSSFSQQPRWVFFWGNLRRYFPVKETSVANVSLILCYRYQATKLMEVLFTRELVARLGSFTRVIINLVNPGLCISNLDRNNGSPVMKLVRRILDRTTEVGSRTLVLAASAPASSHGEFQSDGANQDVEAWIYTEVGQEAQKKVFEQTMHILEARKPGIAAIFRDEQTIF